MYFIFKNPMTYKGIISKTAEEDWQNLITDNQPSEEELQSTFIDGVNNLQENTNQGEIKQGVEENNIDQINAAIPYDSFLDSLGNLIPILIGAYLFGAKDGKKKAPAKIRDLDFELNMNNENAMKWIKENSAELIKGISEETKTAVKSVIKRAISQELNPDIATKHIRNIVGLTERQALAVNSYMDRLIKEGMSPKEAEIKSSKYAKRLIEFRAETIAKTELMKAVNTGHMSYVTEAIKKGLIKENDYVKTWYTAKDERVCPVCAPMNGKKVNPTEPFETTIGDVMIPPAHPRCRCIPVFQNKGK